MWQHCSLIYHIWIRLTEVAVSYRYIVGLKLGLKFILFEPEIFWKLSLMILLAALEIYQNNSTPALSLSHPEGTCQGTLRFCKAIGYANWFMGKQRKDMTFMERDLFTNEAGFFKSGVINSYNLHIVQQKKWYMAN